MTVPPVVTMPPLVNGRRREGLLRFANTTLPMVDGWHVLHRCSGVRREVTAMKRGDQALLVCLHCGETMEVRRRPPVDLAAVRAAAAQRGT